MARHATTVLVAWLGSVLLACSDGTGADGGMQGEYALRQVHFGDTLPQPVPAVHVVGADTTVTERGRLTSLAEDTWALELVYTWRYGGAPGGATIADTLRSVFDTTGTFGTDGVVQWFRLLRGPDHVAYLLRRQDGTLILDAYDRAGTVDFYFQR